MTVVDMTTVVPVSQMIHDDPEETALLQKLFVKAESYLRSFKWCHDIKDAYFGDGIGGVVGVFLFRIDGPPSVDEWLWVVSGDIPSCYMVTDAAPNPAEALKRYCELMEQWVLTVRGDDESVQEIFPVDAPATQGNADDLESRIEFIREHIMPVFQSFVGD